jgi:hypothetical protein
MYEQLVLFHVTGCRLQGKYSEQEMYFALPCILKPLTCNGDYV